MRWSRYTPASVTLEDHHGLERVPMSRRWLGGLKPSSRPEDLVNFDARHVFHDVFLSPTPAATNEALGYYRTWLQNTRFSQKDHGNAGDLESFNTPSPS